MNNPSDLRDSDLSDDELETELLEKIIEKCKLIASINQSLRSILLS